MLQSRQVEVEYLLRSGLASNDEVQQARASVGQALRFDEELGELAAAKGVSKGKLFQAMVEALRKAGESSAQLDNSGEHLEGLGNEEFGLSVAEWAVLTQKADSLRKLVRIKLADDNDLKTARSGLELCDEFFKGVVSVAEARRVSEHAVYITLVDKWSGT